jgi:hypothetical protein
MYRLVEIEDVNNFKTYTFSSEEKFCNHLMNGKMCVVFSLNMPHCFINKCYLFRKPEVLNTYYDIFISALNTDKSLEFVCDLFEKLHSNNFMIFNFSENQKKASNNTY